MVEGKKTPFNWQKQWVYWALGKWRLAWLAGQLDKGWSEDGESKEKLPQIDFIPFEILALLKFWQQNHFVYIFCRVVSVKCFKLDSSDSCYRHKIYKNMDFCARVMVAVFINYYDNYVETLAEPCPKPTFVAEVVSAASSVARRTGRTRSPIFVWSMTPPVPPENTTTWTLSFSRKRKTWFSSFKSCFYAKVC